MKSPTPTPGGCQTPAHYRTFCHFCRGILAETVAEAEAHAAVRARKSARLRAWWARRKAAEAPGPRAPGLPSRSDGTDPPLRCRCGRRVRVVTTQGDAVLFRHSRKGGQEERLCTYPATDPLARRVLDSLRATR